MTLVSIVVPTRGGATRLPRLLNALTAQEYDNWEAVVVVDGDTDGSADLLANHRDPRVRSVVFPSNRGRVSALNAGFESAQGEVLVRCDDDLEPKSDYVARHLANHGGPAVGVVGLYLNQLEPNRYSRVYGDKSDRDHRRAAYQAPPNCRWIYWAGNCSVTRDTWNTVGPYDSRYRAYGWEDVDYGYRLHCAGVPILLDPLLETTHHAAATTTLSRSKRAFRSGQARHLFESIHGQGVSGPRHEDSGGAWNVLVGQLSRRLTYEATGRTATCVDAVIPYLPVPLGRKSIALLIEAASAAGMRSPEGATNDF